MENYAAYRELKLLMHFFLLQVDFLVNVEAIDNSTGHVLLDDTGLMDRAGQTITATSMAVNGSTVVNAPLLQIMVTIEVRIQTECY